MEKTVVRVCVDAKDCKDWLTEGKAYVMLAYGEYYARVAFCDDGSENRTFYSSRFGKLDNGEGKA